MTLTPVDKISLVIVCCDTQNLMNVPVCKKENQNILVKSKEKVRKIRRMRAGLGQCFSLLKYSEITDPIPPAPEDVFPLVM